MFYYLYIAIVNSNETSEKRELKTICCKEYENDASFNGRPEAIVLCPALRHDNTLTPPNNRAHLDVLYIYMAKSRGNYFLCLPARANAGLLTIHCAVARAGS